MGVEPADLDRIRERFEQQVRERFPGAPIDRVAVLQYGDDPQIEPGELLGRVYLEVTGDPAGREETLHSFHDTYRDAMHELRKDLDELPQASVLEFVVAGDQEAQEQGPVIKLGRRRRGIEGGAPLVSVMARLGPVDVETVDTLITAGVAANRAEAIRWALSRIRERPAFTQLRELAREVENLKAQL